MRIERTALLLVASLLAGSPAYAQQPRPAPPAPAPRPAPAKAAPKKVAPKPAPPRPAPPPPPTTPTKKTEDEAIIEQLELFMLMEMMKDYEILRETE